MHENASSHHPSTLTSHQLYPLLHPASSLESKCFLACEGQHGPKTLKCPAQAPDSAKV